MEHSERKLAIQTTVVAAALVLIGAALSTEVWLHGRNTLLVNGQWISSKVYMEMGTMGSRNYFVTRNATQRNRLNLGAWHGFNELTFNDLFEPGEIRLRFKLESDAHINVLFNRDESGYQGVRFSRAKIFDSELFSASREGEFGDRKSLDVGYLGSDWHSLELRFDPSQMTVILDEREIATWPVARRPRQFVSLRGGERPAYVDDVTLVDADGRAVAHETFRNARGYSRVFGQALGVLVVATLIMATVLVAPRRGVGRRNGMFVILSFHLAFISSVTAYLAFDYYVWSGRYVYQGFLPRPRDQREVLLQMEALRGRIFGVPVNKSFNYKDILALDPPLEIRRAISTWDLTWRRGHGPIDAYRPGHAVPEGIEKEEIGDLPPKARGTYRIGFFGTSQTGGAGAELRTEMFVARVHQMLGEVGGKQVETYNFAIGGQKSWTLLPLYRDYWIKADLDLLVVNLSTNDTDSRKFRASLTELANLNRARGVETAFVLEPNAAERKSSWLKANHALMREVAAEFGVPVWDMSGHFAREGVRDSGFLWWDFVHLSSLGHRVAAEFLVERIRPLIAGEAAA